MFEILHDVLTSPIIQLDHFKIFFLEISKKKKKKKSGGTERKIERKSVLNF